MDSSYHHKLSILELNPEFIKLVESKHLAIGSIEVFRLEATNNTRWPIHVDGPVIGDFPKMNFVFGNNDCPMIWYREKIIGNKIASTTSIGTPYLEYQQDEVEEVERFCIRTAIVQAGVPHTVVHKGKDTRWAVSLCFVRSYGRPSYNELLQSFREFSV
jgi:hypothetical protein